MVGLTSGTEQSAAREPRHSDTIQPPPPYERNTNTPVLLAETTTTRTEVVTTTTTHFFSLPLWRKRGLPVSRSVTRSTLGEDAGLDEHGRTMRRARSSVLLVEKDLPPTPPSERDSKPPNGRLSDDTQRRRSMYPKPFSPVDLHTSTIVNDPPPAMESTVALARAALGLGLPHTLPHASGSPSPSEINSIAFLTSSPRSSDIDPSPPRLRRAKSSQRFDGHLPATTGIYLKEDGRRRSRGFSFGSNSFLDFGPIDSKGKGKARESTVEKRSGASPKPITRRASFWSRKKSTPLETPILPAPQETPKSYLIPLPTLQPVSPFDMNMTITSPQEHENLHLTSHDLRGLTRSHSARLRSSQSKADEVTTKALLSGARPRTADSSGRIYGRTSIPFVHIPPNLPPKIPPPAPINQVSPELHPSKRPSRPRAQTNPPRASRVSMDDSLPSIPSSPSGSRGSFSNLKPTMIPGNLYNQSMVNVPKPLTDEESPSLYLRRLQSAVSKAEVAGILASSADAFHVQALRTYVGQFDFVADPLDVALRKLLMEVGLPRETQQIDRVIEAFAGRYLECNPMLFTSEDHPYVLAFSLIMLHTDAFNKSNKRKMTKADYIKNTRLPGVGTEVLDCFYDNIVFAPFIFIEDHLDVNGQRGLTPEGSSSRIVSPTSTGPNFNGPALMRSTKVDPYYLITKNLLEPLRVNVHTCIPMDSPYSYEGTAGPWDDSILQHVFAKAGEIEVTVADQGRTSPLFSLNVAGGPPSPMGSMGAHAYSSSSAGNIWTLKVTKLGLLNRKDDILAGGKKALTRKWKPWSVILTGSQLLFFRDLSWPTLLSTTEPLDGSVVYPQSAVFRPDELLSVKDAIAVYDKSYTKYENTFRFVLPNGRQLLLQALGDTDLNEWISRINYASAFKSAGVRMRPLEMSGIDVKLTGVAAATSHLHDLQHQGRSLKAHTASQEWDGDTPRDLMRMLSGDSELTQPPSNRKVSIVTGLNEMDIGIPVAPEVDGADQFKATFDQVKADLAAGRWTSSDSLTDSDPLASGQGPRSTDLPPTGSDQSRLPSRSQIMQSKIQDLESKITAAHIQLEADMRLVRNIATLTPFQKSTRDRLIATIQNIAKRVMQVRLEYTRLVCHRDVLVKDLASQGRSWHRAKIIALQAATETLQSRHLPKVTLTYHDEPFSQYANPTPSHRPESSICESFHSAMDFGPDWPSAEDVTSSIFLGAPGLFDSPKRSNSGSLCSLPPLDAEVGSQSRSSHQKTLSPNVQQHSEDDSPRTSDDTRSHERFYTAHESLEEEAEIWNKTRCAQRVSLVRLPSNIQMSARFGRLDSE